MPAPPRACCGAARLARQTPLALGAPNLARGAPDLRVPMEGIKGNAKIRVYLKIKVMSPVGGGVHTTISTLFQGLVSCGCRRPENATGDENSPPLAVGRCTCARARVPREGVRGVRCALRAWAPGGGGCHTVRAVRAGSGEGGSAGWREVLGS